MKILPILPVIFLTGAAHAVNLPPVQRLCYTPCLADSISNGSMSCQTHTYVSPNCIDDCPCGMSDIDLHQYMCSCNSGYYSSTTAWSSTKCSCVKCPNNATCSDGGTITCNKGYYKNGSSCAACPSSGTTKSSGATSITECYLPSGTSFSDSYGSGTYTSDCYYSN